MFGTWNVRSQYVTGSLTAVARELASYKSDLVGVQEVRSDKEVTVRAEDYIISMEKAKKIINWEQDVLCTTEEYQHLREQSLLVTGFIARRCNILVLKRHAKNE